MNNRIDELMDTFDKDELELLFSQIPIEIRVNKQLKKSVAHRVFEKAGMSVEKKRSIRPKNIKLLLAAAVLILMATGAGYYVGIAEFLKGVFTAGGDLSSEQIQIIESMSYYINTDAVVTEGYALRAIGAAGDKNSAYIVLEFESADCGALQESDMAFSTRIINYSEGIPDAANNYLGSYLEMLEDQEQDKSRFVLYIENQYPEFDLMGKTIEIYLANLYRADDIYGKVPLAYGPWELAVTIEHQDDDILAEYDMESEIELDNKEISIAHIAFSPLQYSIIGTVQNRADISPWEACSIAFYDINRNLIIEVENTVYEPSYKSGSNESMIQFSGLFPAPVNHKDIQYVIINGVEIELK